jgi:uncharacterized membrane protein (DUF4010 family)
MDKVIAIALFAAAMAIIGYLGHRSEDVGGSVPEPSSIAILAVGLAGLLAASKRFRRGPSSPEPPEEL